MYFTTASISETWEDKLIATHKRAEAKLSLRMWSDSVSFSRVAEKIDLVPAIILEKGEPTDAPKGSARKYRAKRNYVSFGDSVLDDGPSLPVGIEQFLNSIAVSDLAPEIRSDAVEAAIWLAIFKDTIPWDKFVSPALSDRAKGLNVALMMEDYTRFDTDGVPLIEFL
jgi:hypothetical protein